MVNGNDSLTNVQWLTMPTLDILVVNNDLLLKFLVKSFLIIMIYD